SIFAPLQDIVPPTTTKDIGNPKYPISGPNEGENITISTPIWLNATDGGSGLNATYYMIWNGTAWHPSGSGDGYGGNDNITSNGTAWWYVYYNDTINFGPIYFTENCTHYLKYYSVDYAGNNETIHNQTHYVDGSPPDSSVDQIVPYNVTHVPVTINVTASDVNCTPGCGIDYVELWYRNSSDNSTWSNWMMYGIGYSEPYRWLFYAPNGSQYYEFRSIAADNLGNKETAPVTADAMCNVTNAPPITTIHVSPLSIGSKDFINASTEFNFTVEDPDGDASNATIKYRWWWNGVWTEWQNYTGNFTSPFVSDCKHYLEYYAIDEDGNIEATHNRTYYLDGTPPVSHLNVGSPNYNNYVSESTHFTLSATDYGCEGGVGVDEIRYRIDSGPWNTYSGNFNLTGQCLHTIEWYAVDNLGNEEAHHSENFRVDITPPTSDSYVVGEISGDFVNTDTVLNLNATDTDGSCNVENWKIHWRVWYSGAWHGWYKGDWNSVISIPFNEECTHYVEWYAEDRVDNVESTIHNRTFYVDDTSPLTTYTIHGPHASGSGFTWINYSSYITLDATDYGCNGGVGVDKTYFRYVFDSVSHPTSGTDTEYGTPVNIGGTWYWVWVGQQSQKIQWAEDCIHTLYYFSVDKLSNEETAKQVTFRVDNTPPDTSGRLALTGANYASGGDTWVKTSTSFSFDLTPDPDGVCTCCIGLDKIEYRILKDPDNDGWDGDDDTVEVGWTDYTTSFNIPTECHHKIEWYGIDELGNNETSIHYEEYYVDDTPPASSKAVGDPKWPESGADEGRWVNTSTPITLTASDMGGCAVGSWRVNWEIWLNGSKIESGIGSWDTPVVINFHEACNHTLKWWAEDRLGNTEGIHIQYHYVDNTPPDTSDILEITGYN
ncbi:MAG: hypothetical protein JRJ13_20030, partial [Deltaproteobacteria bacterium]|nr:hypothetical protein [Deltaproteobacteria bacterium]